MIDGFRLRVGLGLTAVMMGCTSSSPMGPGQAADVDVGDRNRVRFVAIGDQGSGNASQRLVAEAMATVCAERGCDFALFLGDNVYPRGLERPEDPVLNDRLVGMYTHLGIPLYPVLGNHDYGNSRQVDRAQWQVSWAQGVEDVHMPAAWYGFSAGSVRLWGLDTTGAFWGWSDTEQAAWLDAELEDAGAASWRVVFGHHTFRSNGPHGNAGQYEGWRGLPWASGQRLKSLFETQLCGRVDLYLSGHDHSRQWMEHCGVQVVVSGAGSKATEIVDRGNLPHFAVADEGLVWVELTPDAMRLAFVDERGALEHEAVWERP